MTYELRRHLARAFADRCHALGFETWLAKAGTYGFFTNADGSRVVSFEADHYGMGVKLSGDYEPSAKNGTGWVICENIAPPKHADQLTDWLNEVPPRWISRPLTPCMTREYKLKFYSASQYAPVDAAE